MAAASVLVGCLLTGSVDADLGYVAPRGYVCHRAGGSIEVDGRLDKAVWSRAPWTEDFVDIEGDRKPLPRFRTRAKMLWDDECLYIGAELEEPHVWATLTEHDCVIFQDNDFEIFIDPDSDSHSYFEIECNAFGTEWDLRLPKPYRDGGSAENEWEIPGYRVATHVEGTINDASDTDRFWSIEIALPWSAFAEHGGMPCPPRPGDQWRIDFSRVEWDVTIEDGAYRKVPGRPEHNWVWSPQGVVDMHRPETWGYVQFSDAEPGTEALRPDPTGPARWLLQRVYYAQRSREAPTGSLGELGLAGLTHESVAEGPWLELTAEGWRAWLRLCEGIAGPRTLSIRHDSLVSREE